MMGSILGFSTHRSPSRIGVRTFRVPGTNVYVPVRAEVAPLLIGFLQEFHQTVEPLRPGWNWGYAFRAIRDSVAPSRHSAGIAVDFNAPRHPLGRRGTFSPRQAAQIRALCAKYGLRWGGSYRGRADEMHAEINESRAAALARVRRLQSRPAARPAPARPAPGPKAPGPTLKRGSNGPQVTRWQNGLKRTVNARLSADGDFGAGTHSATVEFQRRCRLAQDGVVGPVTWREMFRRVPSL